MRNEKETWQNLTDSYLRRVEKVLSRVDHPRKKEVLGDLRDHMAQHYADMPAEERTPEKMAAVIETMDAPEEYAELLSPATGAASQKWYRRRVFRFSTAAIVALVAIRFIFLPDTPTLAAHVRELFGVNYTATPFFSRKNFERIKPGMAPDEVRDLIGFPYNRYSIVGKENEARWEYSVAAVPGAHLYREFMVFFDRDSERVLRTETRSVWHGYPHGAGAPESIVRSVAGYRRKVGTLRLRRPDDSELVLRPSDKTVYLIRQVAAVGRSSLSERLRYHVNSIETAFGWLEDENVPVLYLMTEYSSREPILDGEKSASPGENVFATSQPAVRETGSRMLIYKEGILYKLPPVYIGHEQDEAAWRADQQWIVRRLLQ